MNLLALDTATDACSAALWLNGQIVERFTVEPRQHTRLILNMVDQLMVEAGLARSQLDGVALCRGPGSFTGVRIATAVAHGIALGLDIPVALVSSLAALAQHQFNQRDAQLAYVAMDARMDEIFWGIYQRDQRGYAELLGEEAVLPAQNVEGLPRSGIGVGSGWSVYADVLQQRLNPHVVGMVANVWPQASCVAQLGADLFTRGEVVPVEQAQPVYLRDKVAKTVAERHAESLAALPSA